MRITLLAVVLAGCAFCHAPPRPVVPPGVEATAFIDQGQDCYTVELRPGADLVLTALVAALKIFAGGGGE